jgi:iron complex transport system substrate-binding protein
VAAFPVTVTGFDGTKVAIESRPDRIVSLTPAVTETLFKIGAGDRVVGRSEDPNPYPAEAAGIPALTSMMAVDLEKVVALEPDLVIAGGLGFTPDEAITQLRNAGIPVLVVYATDVAGVLDDIRTIGTAAGETEAANTLADTMRSGIDAVAVAAAAAGATRPRVFYEIDATGDIYGPADASFIAEMVDLAGGDPITTGSPDVYSIPLERLIEANPEVIVLGDAAYGVTPEAVAARSGWGTMTAVKSGAIRPVDDIVITRPGPRLVEGLRALADAINPGVALP